MLILKVTLVIIYIISFYLSSIASFYFVKLKIKANAKSIETNGDFVMKYIKFIFLPIGFICLSILPLINTVYGIYALADYKVTFKTKEWGNPRIDYTEQVGRLYLIGLIVAWWNKKR